MLCDLFTILGVLFGRSLGVHFSKVRSLTLDMWEPELLKVSRDEHTDGQMVVEQTDICPDAAILRRTSAALSSPNHLIRRCFSDTLGIV